MGKIIDYILEENWKHRDDLERETSNKIKMWESMDSTDIRKSLIMQEDATIWAYNLLKDPEGNQLKMYGFQDKILNDRNRFVAVAAANQIGKTLSAACIKAIHHAIHVSNALVGIVSKSEDQANFVLGEIKKMLNSANIKFEKGDIENRTEIHLKAPNNTISIIITGPPTTSILGYPFTLIICDEVSFWELKLQSKEINTQLDFYEQVLEPRTNATKDRKHDFITMGQIIMISNPFGHTGLLWYAFQKDDRFNCYQYSWLARPSNKYEDFLKHKKRLNPFRFDSIYGCKFTSGEGGLISIDEWETAYKDDLDIILPIDEPIYLGADLAGESTTSKNVDSNVIYGIIKIRQEGKPDKLRIVYQKDFGQRAKKSEIYEEIDRLKKRCNIVKFVFDRGGNADSVKNSLIDKNILSSYQVEGIAHSLKGKTDIYTNLSSLFEQGRIEIPKGTYIQLRDQLFGLRTKETEGGHLKIHHYSEKVHDDHPDAFANACWGALRLESGEVSLSYVEAGEMKKTDYIKRVVCLKCGEDWDYIDEEECIFCGAGRKDIAHYHNHIPI